MSNEQEMREALIEDLSFLLDAYTKNRPIPYSESYATAVKERLHRYKAALSTEAQPEVTGAVAKVHYNGDGYGVRIFDSNKIHDGDLLYPPFAIKAKLDEAAALVERQLGGYAGKALADDIRALGEVK